jgi:hypothetical protein
VNSLSSIKANPIFNIKYHDSFIYISLVQNLLDRKPPQVDQFGLDVPDNVVREKRERESESMN